MLKGMKLWQSGEALFFMALVYLSCHVKILLLNANLAGVGTYVRALHFGEVFASAGHSVTLCTVSRSKQYRKEIYSKNGVTILEMPKTGYSRLPGWGSGWLDILMRMRLISVGNFDCVYGFEYQPNVAWPVYLTHSLLKYNFLSDWCDWHSGGSNKFRNINLAIKLDGFFEEKIRFVASRVSVISNRLLERALKIGIPSVKIIQIGEGVDTTFIKPLPKAEMRDKYGINLATPVIATITDSNMARPVEILAGVRQWIPGAELLVIGRKDPEVSTMAEQLGLQAVVHQTGFIPNADLPGYLACADVCFLPLEDNLSNQARWPAKVNDFLAAGKPSVISPVGDIAGFYKEDPIGCLAITNKDFIDTLVDLLSRPAECKMLGGAARQLAVEKLDWEGINPNILGLIN
jgi:glycosyltransferase involved in cell wall biosynthesis